MLGEEDASKDDSICNPIRLVNRGMKNVSRARAYRTRGLVNVFMTSPPGPLYRSKPCLDADKIRSPFTAIKAERQAIHGLDESVGQ